MFVRYDLDRNPAIRLEPQHTRIQQCLHLLITWSDKFIGETLANLICNRHKRTHDRGEGADNGLNLSGEDEEEYSGEDQLGSLEEASANSESGYIPTSLSSVATSTPTANGLATGGMAQSSFNPLQTLSMPMTMSTPAGAM